jgi:hypothetical protein
MPLANLSVAAARYLSADAPAKIESRATAIAPISAHLRIRERWDQETWLPNKPTIEIIVSQ